MRLNEKLYDGAVFEDQGMKHIEMVRPRVFSHLLSHEPYRALLALTALSGRLESAGTIREGVH